MPHSLVLFELNDEINVDHSDFDGVAACLLASDHPTSITYTNFQKLILYRCKFFMSWGNFSEEIHDSLDQLLEKEDLLDQGIVTTSHKGESIEELSWFFVNATFPTENNIKYFFGYNANMKNISHLIERINKNILARNHTK